MFTTTIVVLVAAELRFKNDRVGHVPTDLAAKNNWTDDFPECEPEPAPACLTKTCVTGASAWSGLRECTCDDEKPASPKLTPLDLMRKAWMQSASVVSTINTTSESAQIILLVWPELWQVDPSNGRSAVVNGSEVFQDPLDFALWYDQEAILVQAQKGGSRICQLALSNDSSALSVECGDNDNRHLDDTDVPLWLQITLDWIHGTYYWSGDDENYGAIGVYDIATKRRRVLFHGLKNQIEPSDVVVDPLAGYIFWIDNARRAIVRADTDGRNMTEVVMLPLIQALALDVGDQRIYWIKSSSLHIIASSDYSGNDVRTVFRSCLFVKGMSASLAVLDQRVFWTNDDTLFSVAKNGSESIPRIHHVANAHIDSVRSWDSRGQPKGSNKCEGHRCAWLCLPRSPGYGRYDGNSTSAAEEPLSYSCACDLDQRSVWRDGTNLCVDDSSERHDVTVPL